MDSPFLTSLQSLYSEGQIATLLSRFIHPFIRQATEILRDFLQEGIFIFLNGPNPGNMVTSPYDVSCGKIFYCLNRSFISAKWWNCKSSMEIVVLL
jgi:hypothetical protein